MRCEDSLAAGSGMKPAKSSVEQRITESLKRLGAAVERLEGLANRIAGPPPPEACQPSNMVRDDPSLVAALHESAAGVDAGANRIMMACGRIEEGLF